MAISDLLQGNYAGAAINAAGMLPVVGNAIAMGSLAADMAGLDIEGKLNSAISGKTDMPVEKIQPKSEVTTTTPIAPGIASNIAPASTTTQMTTTTTTTNNTIATNKTEALLSRMNYLIEQWLQKPPTLAVEFNDGVVKKLDSTMRKSTT